MKKIQIFRQLNIICIFFAVDLNLSIVNSVCIFTIKKKISVSESPEATPPFVCNGSDLFKKSYLIPSHYTTSLRKHTLHNAHRVFHSCCMSILQRFLLINMLRHHFVSHSAPTLKDLQASCDKSNMIFGRLICNIK